MDDIRYFASFLMDKCAPRATRQSQRFPDASVCHKHASKSKRSDIFEISIVDMVFENESNNQFWKLFFLPADYFLECGKQNMKKRNEFGPSQRLVKMTISEPHSEESNRKIKNCFET